MIWLLSIIYKPNFITDFNIYNLITSYMNLIMIRTFYNYLFIKSLPEIINIIWLLPINLLIIFYILKKLKIYNTNLFY